MGEGGGMPITPFDDTMPVDPDPEIPPGEVIAIRGRRFIMSS